MASAERLYTPELLALTLKLANFPLATAYPLMGSARSKSCGSTIALGIALDADSRIVSLGLRPQACAVGQAAAAIFAEGAIGMNLQEIIASLEQIRRWLSDGAPLPEWPGIAPLIPAREFPGRHGAIALAWEAAADALSQATDPR